MFLLVLLLNIEKAFLIAFFCQAIFFQYGLSFDIGSYAMVIVFVRLLFLKGNKVFSLIKRLTTIKLFFALFFAILFWSSIGGGLALYTITTFTRVGISLFLFAYLFSSNLLRIRLFIHVAIIALVVNLINAYLINSFLHPYIQPLFEGSRLSARGITGVRVNSNTYAYMIMVLLSVFLGYLFKENKKKKLGQLREKIILLVLTSITLVILGYMGSRTVILGVVTIAILYTINIKSFYYFLPFLILVFFTLGFWNIRNMNIPLIGDSANERIAAIRSQELSDRAMNSRSSLIEAGIKIFLDHPFFGVGTGNIVEKMASPKYHGARHVPHNFFVTILAEFGILGTISVFFYFLKLWINITVGNYKFGVIFFILFILSNMSHDYSQLNIFWIAMCFYEVVEKSGKFSS